MKVVKYLLLGYLRPRSCLSFEYFPVAEVAERVRSHFQDHLLVLLIEVLEGTESSPKD